MRIDVNSVTLQHFAAILTDEWPSSEFNLSAQLISDFCLYYSLVLKWNPFLHLTTITLPHEFVRRHILESIFSSKFLAPSITEIVDVGSGLGVPGIPLSIINPNLEVSLIESSRKKSVFLKEVVSNLKLDNVQVVNDRFESQLSLTFDSCTTIRALDGFRGIVPKIFHYFEQSTQLLLWGNQELLDDLQIYCPDHWEIQSHPLPATNESLLISLIRFT